LLKNNLYLALIHHPVVNKRGDLIVSALTTIDLHDIARAAITFGVRGFYVVTPLTDHQDLAEEVISHWTKGVGGELNPFRKDALELIRVKATFEDALADIEEERGRPVVTAATTAVPRDGAVEFPHFSGVIQGSDDSHLISFGTAWGLSPAFLDGCDHVLEPVTGVNGYNHLSVRSAVSIVLDRLRRDEC